MITPAIPNHNHTLEHDERVIVVNGNSLPVAVIGLGGQALRKAIPALQRNGATINAIVDPAIDLKIPTKLTTSQRFSTIPDMLKNLTPGAAYVAVPHHAHYDTVAALLQAGTHVIKEKPLALNLKEGQDLVRLAERNGTRLAVATQRDFSQKYQWVRKFLPKIGSVRSVQVTESIVEPKLDYGWRAEKGLAGGGVVIDLGYHMLHQLVRLFGSETRYITARLVKTRGCQHYNVEDTAHLLIGFASGVDAIITLSRAGAKREEVLKIVGENGVIALDGDRVTVSGSGNPSPFEEVNFVSNDTSQDNLTQCLHQFLANVVDWRAELDAHLGTMALIDNIYEESKFSATTQSTSIKWIWPRITPDVEVAVSQQLHKTLSIYDHSGVFGEFEAKFKEYHSVPDWYSLLHNSGTNALFSLYYAAGIGSGDEVIVPVYTFHATVSPLMQLGAIPVFVDASPETGNISPDAIKAAIGPKTKAVVVTHMWGIPCAMTEIAGICKQNGILLLEDCSHAHGARLGDAMVGTFGDGAAWSLQGEKVLTGGEGGITITCHREMHIKMLLLGHYNKRCKVEIPGDHPLRQYALTGVGLKNRAHPLPVAIMFNQLSKLPTFLEQKAQNAKYMSDKIGSIPFLIPPHIPTGAKPSWYAFVITFDQLKAPNGLTREAYVKALHAKGLVDADIPGSTKPLHLEPLYRTPWEVLGHLYSKSEYPIQRTRVDQEFKGADAFYKSSFKLPVWAFESDFQTVEFYVQAMLEVADDAINGKLK